MRAKRLFHWRITHAARLSRMARTEANERTRDALQAGAHALRAEARRIAIRNGWLEERR